MKSYMDHLVIGAASLEQGVDFVKEKLGVEMPFGGTHLKMGTHNHLMQLGNNTFLEIIAINNEIENPSSPRWYGLDDPYIQERVSIEPTLLTWVINTENINDLISSASFSLGKAELISRGNLSWYFGLPEDGRLLASGMLPYAIEWQTDIHPAKNMSDLGCRLDYLEIYHPYPKWLQAHLSSINALDLVDVKQTTSGATSFLVAHIKTPAGTKKLSNQLNM